MTGIVETLLFMLAVLAGVAVAAQRLKIAPSILLVMAGIGMALIPGLPKIQLAPEIVLLVILPPLIYSAGVSMSWREFRFNLRPITLLAFGCVVFTTCAVAVATHYLLKFDWAIGFLLGAIIAPPDVVAPLAIARRLALPRRLLVVLEGEGLANDATALILYRFAVAAAVAGTFSLPQAAGTFTLIVIGEILFGIAVGWLSLRLRQWAREPRVEITLSLMTPYLAFWVPEHLGGSGVLATVACGLYVSWNGPRLISSATRLQGIFFWDLLVYLVEGLVFPPHRLAGAGIARSGGVLFILRIGNRDGLDHADRCCCAIHMDFPGNLYSALDQPRAREARSGTSVARAFYDRICRRTRCRFPCRRARDPFHSRQRAAVSAPRPDSLRYFRRDRNHARRTRADVAVGLAMAWHNASWP